MSIKERELSKSKFKSFFKNAKNAAGNATSNYIVRQLECLKDILACSGLIIMEKMSFSLNITANCLNIQIAWCLINIL